MKTRAIVLLFATLLPATLEAQAVDLEAAYYANAYADHYVVPRPLVRAIIAQESSWDYRAVSDKGTLGLMQLMPATAKRYGVQRPFNKSENIAGGVRYLHDLLARFGGDMRLAVAAYYTGETRIQRLGLALHDPVVITYVEQVRRRYQRERTRFGSARTEEER